MKRTVLTGVVSLLLLSGVAFAVQPEEQKSGSSMHGMMEQMKKGEKDTDGMMRMMKMMDQCSAMMESAQDQGDKAKESQNKQ